MECDHVKRWVVEFVLRNSHFDKNLTLTKQILSKIPISNSDFRLSKTLLLAELQHHFSIVSIAEPILHTLELLEELHHRSEGSPVSTAMSSAYCAVAVECTLKYLQLQPPESDNEPYLAAVNRIWNDRVRYVSKGSLLFSPELERWRIDIEASLSDLQLRERLASVDSRRDAIAKLRIFLNEQWRDLGPSFLELAASNTLTMKHLEDQDHEREIQRCSAASEKEHLSTTIEVQKVGECGNLELQMSIKDLDSSRVNGEILVEKQSRDADEPCPDGISGNEADVMENGQTSLPESHDRRTSIMEKNSTARTYEWDDSIDGLQDRTLDHNRVHLRSPKGRKPSPLKRYDYKSASITKRRPKKKWSQLEEETLKAAVEEFGRGNWKLILNSHKDIFEERTEVDLKDKWRNMTRYGGK